MLQGIVWVIIKVALSCESGYEESMTLLVEPRTHCICVQVFWERNLGSARHVLLEY